MLVISLHPAQYCQQSAHPTHLPLSFRSGPDDSAAPHPHLLPPGLIGSVLVGNHLFPSLPLSLGMLCHPVGHPGPLSRPVAPPHTLVSTTQACLTLSRSIVLAVSLLASCVHVLSSHPGPRKAALYEPGTMLWSPALLTSSYSVLTWLLFHLQRKECLERWSVHAQGPIASQWWAGIGVVPLCLQGSCSAGPHGQVKCIIYLC